MKILAFAASNSKQSINKKLVTYATSIMNGHNIEIIDLNNFELPLFSEDKEKEIGQPQLAKDFLNKISESDAIFISYAEHNGSYSVAYKNIFDWASRINPKVFQGKKMVVLATSPGPGGASSVLATATASAPYFDGDVKGSISIPSFNDNFDTNTGVLTNQEMITELNSIVNNL
jgi:chromate reductase, NAD(P)H dehydrogenase (quinone)